MGAGSDAMSASMINKAILEINPNHPIVHDLEDMIEKESDKNKTKNFSMLLYDVARITSGYEILDSGEFVKRVMSLMTRDVITFEEEQAINNKKFHVKEELIKETD